MSPTRHVRTFCMLANVYALPLTRLPVSSIHFINALSYNRYIRYQVLHTLFLSICMAVVDYTCIMSVNTRIANS